jgi:hypothetical protein
VSNEVDPKLMKSRRSWVTPMLEPHSTMTVVTQAPLPVPLNLLFLQSSISQCFDINGQPATCPTNPP